ncbi:MAG: hypothetical protein JSV88_03065 [Candidatus Aminicenantes bacterium]|nr:MAG: hypothetical protein JSV88_03065 [Candidatus Aminicenantes bacterium]
MKLISDFLAGGLNFMGKKITEISKIAVITLPIFIKIFTTFKEVQDEKNMARTNRAV